MHTAPPPRVAASCAPSGSARVAARSEIATLLESAQPRAKKDSALARLCRNDPSPLLELVTELATWKVGNDGCASILAAVMRHRIATASAAPAGPALSKSRRRKSL